MSTTSDPNRYTVNAYDNDGTTRVPLIFRAAKRSTTSLTECATCTAG